jgi:hypothetical protein
MEDSKMNSYLNEIRALLDSEGCASRIIPIRAGRHKILVDGYVRGSITVSTGEALRMKSNFQKPKDTQFVRELMLQVGKQEAYNVE